MSGSNPTSGYYSGQSASDEQSAPANALYHSALTHTPAPAADRSDACADAAGSSERSVSLAPPAWAVRLFGGPREQPEGLVEEDDQLQQRQSAAELVESLRESSVVVRPLPSPMSDGADTPRLGSVASGAALPAAPRFWAPPAPAPAAAFEQEATVYDQPPPPQQPLSQGRFGRPYAQHPPPLPRPPSWLAASGSSWASEGAQSHHEQQYQEQQAPYRAPSAASIQRFPSAQQQLQPGEAPSYIEIPAPATLGPQEKSSPTKSIDASAFHLEAYAGATAETEGAAARVGTHTQAGQRPSRTAALRQRHLRQLRQQGRDQYGVPVASTARPFSLWASPHKIGEACTGLGVYFASVKQFITAALLLSLVAIYPLANNLVSQKWAASYTLVVGKDPLLSCEKGWDTNSWVTGTTAGSRCSSSRYSSSYDCPAMCTWSSSRLESSSDAAAQCRGLPPPSLPPAATGGNATCLLHPPCSIGGSNDPAAADGPCYCCELQLDPTARLDGGSSGTTGSAGTVPAAQLWVLFLGQLLFLVWVLILTRSQLRAMHNADARVITASDYTAVIHGVPYGVGDGELRQWCSHYGSLVAAYNIPDAGDAIRIAQRLQMLQIRKAESDAWLCSSACGWSAWCFNLCALGATGSLRLQRQLDNATRKLRCYERQELRPTGTALAVFEYAEHAGNCAEDHHRPAIRRLLDNALCGATDTAPRLASRRVRVRRAPEPSDLIWQHTACTGSAALTRRLMSATLTLVIVGVGAGVQYGLAVAAEDERKKRLSALYRYGTDIDGSLDFSSWAAFTASALQVTKLNVISIVSGLAIVVVNWLVTLAVRRLTVLERWHTRTAGERWALLKLSATYLANAFAVPLLAAYFAGSSNSWYSRGGLLESAFFMQVANALLPPLAVLVDLEDLFYRQVVSRSAKTQAMMNRLLQPPDFLLAEQYASAVTTLGMAVFWMPLLPISPFIAVVGLFLGYWADKVVALRRAAHPGNMRGKLVSSAALLIRLLPLVQLLLMRFLYFLDERSMVAVFWAGLAVWLLFAVAPIRRLLGLMPRRRSTVTGGLSYQETLGGGLRQGLDDCYVAAMPDCCSPGYRQKVAAVFDPLPAPQPADEVLLPRQSVAMGGTATRPPFRPDRSADRAMIRAAASLRASQHASLSSSTAGGAYLGGAASRSQQLPQLRRQAQHGGQDQQQQPGSSRLVRALSAVKDSLAGGANWLWNAPSTDDLFSYDWRNTSNEAPLSSGRPAGMPPAGATPTAPGAADGGSGVLPGAGLSPFQPMGRAVGSREWSGLSGMGSGGDGPSMA